jgi:hypothetical protein
MTRRVLFLIVMSWAIICGVMMIKETPVYAKVIGISLIFIAVTGIVMVVIKNK